MGEKIFVKGLKITKPFQDGQTLNLAFYMPEFDFQAKQFTKDNGYLDISISQSTSGQNYYAEIRQFKNKQEDL